MIRGPVKRSISTALTLLGCTAVIAGRPTFSRADDFTFGDVLSNAWRAAGSSFPSLHTTAAFAIGTVFAESGSDDYRWLRWVLGYGMASGTAYLRLHDNQHWLSDTVAGAALGIATGRFTTHRRLERARDWNLSVTPSEYGGIKLSFNMIIN